MPHPTPRFRFYLMEAAGLFGFVFIAGLLTIVLEHPDMPGKQGVIGTLPTLRHFFLGILLGIYTFCVIRLIGKRSGAHMNPAVTIAHLILKKISLRDASLYVIAQFAGALAASFLLKAALYEWFSHPAIHFGATQPQQPFGSGVAFLAEFLISGIAMSAILITAGSKRLERFGALAMALLICLFITFELPFSGMSMNPARSFSGDAAAGAWAHLWLYFVAPIGAMSLVAVIYRLRRQSAGHRASPDNDHQELPCHPVEQQ